MSSKMSYIPLISSYDDIRAEMEDDFRYRMGARKTVTSLGRPLYYRINLQTFRIGDFFVYATAGLLR